KGERSITLKPEGTAAVVRSFVQNNLNAQGLPQKLYYITPIFRYENPQKGRYRQHHQFGVEYFGSSDHYMDFEVVYLAYMFLADLGLQGISLKLNSIGCPICRPRYIDALQAFINDNIDVFCEQCKVRQNKNPLRVLDCKIVKCKETLKNSPSISDYICDECKFHQSELVKLLEYAKISYSLDPNIVRGLDYYNRTVFEFVADSPSLGNQGTVCGGGRYDNLVENMGGKPINCVGFGMGIERLMAIMEEQGLSFGQSTMPTVSIVYASIAELDDCIQLATELRKHISVDMDFTGKSMKSQLKRADKVLSKYALIIGSQEKENGTVTIKSLSNGVQSCVNLVQFLDNPNAFLL
ncbi:MAG: histidine--tRNA ligase, partial [Firmicutes bacterium]|nr:histidine--tRNA ligase [Bacillota bacterium]